MLQTSNVPDLKLKLICKREHDGCQYNLPSVFEVAALIVGDFDPDNEHRDIVIQHNSGVLQRISELHSSFVELIKTLDHTVNFKTKKRS